MLNNEDYALVGAYIVFYSHIDFNLRRIAEALNDRGALPDVKKGKAAYLTISDVEKAILKCDWNGPNRKALERLVELRGIRNLLAHFSIRRFPSDDAFVFVTKSVRDFNASSITSRRTKRSLPFSK